MTRFIFFVTILLLSGCGNEYSAKTQPSDSALEGKPQSADRMYRLGRRSCLVGKVTSRDLAFATVIGTVNAGQCGFGSTATVGMTCGHNYFLYEGPVAWILRIVPIGRKVESCGSIAVVGSRIGYVADFNRRR